MAGDWIKMRAALCTNPKVLMIADIISQSTEIGRRLSTGFNGSLSELVTSDVTRDITLAALLRVWCATNEHTDDGVWRKSTLKTIDQAAGIPGFGEAMALADWAIYDEEEQTVTLPNFLENNAPAKNNARSSGAERQARYRANKAKNAPERDVTRDVTMSVTSDAREEKRREEKKEQKTKPLPPSGERFVEFWFAWPKSERKQDKVKCEAKWKAKNLDRFADAILADIAVKRQTTKWREGYEEAPLVYLNGCRWEDGVTPGESSQEFDYDAIARKAGLTHDAH